MKRVPLLNGEELDLETILSTHPHVLAVTHPSLGSLPDDATVLDADFALESLPDWLTENHEGTPTTPLAFDGLVSGNNKTEVELQAASTSGSATALQLADGSTVADINPDNWSAIHCYTRVTQYDIDGMSAYIALGDGLDIDFNEGFYVEAQFSGTTFWRVVTGGSSQNTGRRPNTLPQPDTFGFSIVENESGDGHTISWFINGEALDEWNESEGWPSSSSMNISMGVREFNGTEREARFDRLLIILVP